MLTPRDMILNHATLAFVFSLTSLISASLHTNAHGNKIKLANLTSKALVFSVAWHFMLSWSWEYIMPKSVVYSSILSTVLLVP